MNKPPTFPIGARYRVRMPQGWRAGTWQGNGIWQLDDRSLTNHACVLEVGDPIIEVDWVRDPFAATVRMSAMVRVMQ